MGSDHGAFTVGSLHVDHDHDVTLQNLLQALALNFELRARYRAFEYEARQDHLEASARVFSRLWVGQGRQIADLLQALRGRLQAIEQSDEDARGR